MGLLMWAVSLRRYDEWEKHSEELEQYDIVATNFTVTDAEDVCLDCSHV